jgi:hypothetical protein
MAVPARAVNDVRVQEMMMIRLPAEVEAVEVVPSYSLNNVGKRKKS